MARLFGLLLVGIGLVGGLATASVVVTARSYDSATRLRELQLLNGRVLQAMTDAETGLRGYSLTGDVSFLQPYETGRRNLQRDLPQALDAVRDPAVRSSLQTQRALAARWFRSYAEPTIEVTDRGGALETPESRRGKAIFDDLRHQNARADARLWALDAQVTGHASDVRLAAIFATLAVTLGAGLLCAGVAVRTTREFVLPLHRLGETVLRLTRGDGAARAEVAGPAEVTAVAVSINALADESERLRFRQAEADRLRQLAGDIGRQVRDHIDIANLVAEASAVIGIAFDADRVYVRLSAGDELEPGIHEWTHPTVPPVRGPHLLINEHATVWAQELYDSGTTFATRDAVQDPAFASEWGRRYLAATGARSLLLVPFGDGAELLGTLTLVGLDPGRTWSAEEISALQQIGSDLARGLVHGRQYDQQREVVERLRELDRTKTDFLSTVSHELRTPLTSIAGYVELIRDGDAGEVPPEVDAMLAVVDRNTGRLKALIEDLLTLSRIESGAFRVGVGAVDVAALVRSCAETIRPAADSADLELEIEPGPAGLQVDGDLAQLERAVLNLASNAVKFTPPGGRVRLSARSEGEEVLLRVEDTGIGIPDADRDRLGTRFFRATNATANAIQGTGLGLTIVRGIVDHHGGSMNVRSVENVGTSVELALPLGRRSTGGTDVDAPRFSTAVSS